jgi:hypothetical protein
MCLHFPLLAVAAVAVLIVGCGSPVVAPGPSVRSVVHALPVPANAKLTQHARNDSGDQIVDVAYYRLPDGVSMRSLQAWYAARIPAGRKWATMKQCPRHTQTIHVRATDVYIYWVAGDTSLSLRTSDSGGGPVIGLLYSDTLGSSIADCP